MTAKELAALIDGREAGCELTYDEERQAEESGLVVLYTPRADLTKLRGAIEDQIECARCFDQIYISRNGFLPCEKHCSDNCSLYRAATKWAIELGAEFQVYGEPYCLFAVDIPHEEFRTYLIDFGGTRP